VRDHNCNSDRNGNGNYINAEDKPPLRNEPDVFVESRSGSIDVAA
jgi:hypothetical protein